MKIILSILLICAFNARAVDHTFSYQGELKDGISLANGTYDIAIQAYDAASLGNTVGTVSTHTVTVTDGIFTIPDVNLGIATFDGLDIWLQINVKKPADASYTSLIPLQKMASVPYATTLIDKGATNGQVLTFDNASGWQPATPPSGFNGAFSSLTGVPAGLADGDDDTQLTETQVDGFVANNGYVNSTDTTAWDKNAADDFNGAFNSLTGVPAGLADGDDDTQLTEAQVDGFANNNGYVNSADTTDWDKNAADDFSGDMNNNKIINLADPTIAADATNKQYVDSEINALNTKIDALTLSLGGSLIVGGIQQNISVSTITDAGWQECYKGLYSESGLDLATIISACPKSKLMMACRVTNSPTLSLLAADYRDNVLFDVGNGVSAKHDSTFVSWYYSDNRSWGFLPLGETVNRSSCDFQGTNPDKRLCWHTLSGNLNSGYRCGNTFNSGERLIYQHD